jgi:hypothetical protein
MIEGENNGSPGPADPPAPWQALGGAGEPNGCLNDAPCPPSASHGASIRQPFGAGADDSGARGGAADSQSRGPSMQPAVGATVCSAPPRSRKSSADIHETMSIIA